MRSKSAQFGLGNKRKPQTGLAAQWLPGEDLQRPRVRESAFFAPANRLKIANKP